MLEFESVIPNRIQGDQTVKWTGDLFSLPSLGSEGFVDVPHPLKLGEP